MEREEAEDLFLKTRNKQLDRHDPGPRRPWHARVLFHGRRNGLYVNTWAAVCVHLINSTVFSLTVCFLNTDLFLFSLNAFHDGNRRPSVEARQNSFKRIHRFCFLQITFLNCEKLGITTDITRCQWTHRKSFENVTSVFKQTQTDFEGLESEEGKKSGGDRKSVV